MNPPLAGVRVLELPGGIASGFATKQLAGYGADVVCIEGLSDLPSLTDDETAYLTAGKRRVDPAGLDVRALALAADVVVEEGTPGRLGSMQLDPAELLRDKPSLVITSISPFGQTGPYAHYQSTNAVSFAAGGIMSLTGDYFRQPLVSGGSQAQYFGGLHAFAATSTAYLGAVLQGEGDWLDISLQECAAGTMELYGPMTAYIGGDGLPRMGNQTRAEWGIYPCLDGYVGLFALQRQVPALFAAMGDPSLVEEGYLDPVFRLGHADELVAKMYEFTTSHTQAQLLAIGREQRVPIGVALTPADLLDVPSLTERDFWDDVGGVRMPGRSLDGLGWQPPDRLHAPGEDTHGVVTEWLGRVVKTRPLEGVRVADLSMMWAGPYATKLMAEMGAEIVKIESPRAWDNIRTLIPEPNSAEPWNTAFYFQEYNREKKSVVLDLGAPAGRDAFLRLVAQCDVVIENYRADVMDKLDLGFHAVRVARPDVIYVSMAAFGKTGADRDLVGFGPVIELMSGLASLTGYLDDPEPFKTGISYGDPVAGVHAVGAISLALLQRHRTGDGCYIDLAQRQGAAAMAGEAFVAAQRSDGAPPVHMGTRSARWAPQGAYQCQGTQQWLVVSVVTDEQWRACAALLGRDDLASLSLDERRARHDELDSVIGAWAAERDPQDAMDTLQGAGVPAGRVLDSATVHADAHLNERGFWVELANPKMHAFKQAGIAWRLAECETGLTRHAPFFGEHTREVLTGVAGLTDAEVDGLYATGVTADAPVNPGVG